MFTYTYLQTHAHAHTHTSIHTHTCIYTHTNTHPNTFISGEPLARYSHRGRCVFTETKKQSPTTGARANNTLHKSLG